MPKHLLFDFDGTLVDSSPGILASFAGALKRCGRRPVVPLEPGLIGPPLRDTMRRVGGDIGEDELDRLVEAFKDDYDTRGYLQTRAYPGMAAALAGLHDAGAELFIVTNKRIVPTTRILSHLGWDGWFRQVLALDSTVPRTADKSTLIADLIERASIERNDAIMVGDTPEDFAAARSNGLDFAAARWGYGCFDEGALAGVKVLETAEDIRRLWT